MNKEIIHLPVSGPQHKRVPSEVLENYEKLYKKIKDEFPDKEFSKFFPMVGNSYEDANVRLMLVGRSPNGWTALNEKSAEDFSLSAGTAMLERGFDWLDDEGKSKYKDEHKIERIYSINKSSFFRTTKKILKKLLPERASWNRWFENIVWTNLYTIAPLHRGNAEGKLQDVQLGICKKLLIQQIEFYKPTHILFITDWDWWFERFVDEFPTVVKIGDPIKDNVVGCGMFGDVKVVVTVRPDRTTPNKPNEEKFADDVVNAFLK